MLAEVSRDVENNVFSAFTNGTLMNNARKKNIFCMSQLAYGY